VWNITGHVKIRATTPIPTSNSVIAESSSAEVIMCTSGETPRPLGHRASITSARGTSPERRGGLPAVDPIMASAKVSNPQTWNRYTYGLNNPLQFTDPTGMYTCEGDQRPMCRL